MAVGSYLGGSGTQAGCGDGPNHIQGRSSLMLEDFLNPTKSTMKTIHHMQVVMTEKEWKETEGRNEDHVPKDNYYHDYIPNEKTEAGRH